MDILIVLVACPLLALGIGYLYALKIGAEHRPEYDKIA